MLILYSKSACPFCVNVMNFLDDRGIVYEERDVYENDEWMEELMQSGGKRQMPYLVDTNRGVSMYESRDIIQYIEQYYGTNPQIET